MIRLCVYFLSLVLGLAAFNAWSNLENNAWIFHYQNESHIFKRAGDRRGSPFVYLKDLTDKFDLELSTALKGVMYRITHKQSRRWVQISTQSTTLQSSWGPTQLSRPAEFMGKELLAVPIDFGDRALRPLLENRPPLQARLPKNVFEVDVVIDPGHGGNDFGAHRIEGKTELREKDFTLKMAKILAEQLKLAGLQVALTRDEDQYLTLNERTQIANKMQAKLFLSLHLNSEATKKSSEATTKASGYEMYILSLTRSDSEARAAVSEENQGIPEDLPEGVEKAVSDLRAEANFEGSLQWAKLIDTSFKTQRKAFGSPIKMGPFYVLYGTNMPALLIESAFLTHPEDLKWLLDDGAQKKFWMEVATTLASKFKEQSK